MKLWRHAFLLAVGIIALSFEEIEKARKEAIEAVDKQTKKVKDRVSKKNK